MSDKEIIEVISVLKANDKMIKDSGIGDNLWGKAVEYIMFLQSENAALRERLEKAVELPRIVHPNKNEWFIQYQLKSGIIDYSIRYSKEAAEARLAELKGEKE